MASQPQTQIKAAIISAKAALAAEPEPADKATLAHAVNLLQRVYDKNAREGGAQSSPGAQAGYRAIIDKHLPGRS